MEFYTRAGAGRRIQWARFHGGPWVQKRLRIVSFGPWAIVGLIFVVAAIIVVIR